MESIVSPGIESTGFAPKLLSIGMNGDRSMRWGSGRRLPARRGGDEDASLASRFGAGSVSDLDSPEHSRARGLHLDHGEARSRDRSPRPRRAPLRRDGRQGRGGSVSLGPRRRGEPRASCRKRLKAGCPPMDRGALGPGPAALAIRLARPRACCSPGLRSRNTRTTTGCGPRGCTTDG